MSLIDKSILDFYTQSSEDTRLQAGLGPLELERNKDLIARYLPDYPCRIADVGGGTGHYAQWLASLGHAVTLIDPVPRHVALARRKAARARRTFDCVLGEARQLPLSRAAVDVVILHGPLYHLPDAEDRLRALYEARRVLLPSYFHRPAGLREEFEAAGFTVGAVVAVEGIAWLDHQYFGSWALPEWRQRLLELVRLTEADPDLLAVSPHIMAAAELC